MKRDWESLVVAVNTVHGLLRRKPRGLRCPFQCSPGGILNAYREGDVTFKQAVRHLEDWKNRKLAEVTRRK